MTEDGRPINIVIRAICLLQDIAEGLPVLHPDVEMSEILRGINEQDWLKALACAGDFCFTLADLNGLRQARTLGDVFQIIQRELDIFDHELSDVPL